MPSTRDLSLARLIRRSRALDAVARRHWLAVLPHLATEDRERLRGILLDAAAAELAGAVPPVAPHAGEPPAVQVSGPSAAVAPSTGSEGGMPPRAGGDHADG